MSKQISPRLEENPAQDVLLGKTSNQEDLDDPHEDDEDEHEDSD